MISYRNLFLFHNASLLGSLLNSVYIENEAFEFGRSVHCRLVAILCRIELELCLLCSAP